MRRYGLRDGLWDRIKDFLPGREGHVGGTAADNRLFVEAVLYRYRAEKSAVMANTRAKPHYTTVTAERHDMDQRGV